MTTEVYDQREALHALREPIRLHAPTHAGYFDRQPTTSRREKAVELLLSQGYKWVGGEWIAPESTIHVDREHLDELRKYDGTETVVCLKPFPGSTPLFRHPPKGEWRVTIETMSESNGRVTHTVYINHPTRSPDAGVFDDGRMQVFASVRRCEAEMEAEEYRQFLNTGVRGGRWKKYMGQRAGDEA